MGLIPGAWVEVLSAGEILATLEADQSLEGLPFMPEMLAFCGRTFQVQIHADRTCVRALPPGEHEPIRGLRDCVVLVGLRCGGGFHGGCQLGCMLFWKEAWLKQVTGPRPGPEIPAGPPADGLPVNRGQDPSVFFCQGTELGRATTRGQSKWDPREYIGMLRAGTFTVPELVRMLHVAGSRKVELAIRSRLQSHAPPAQEEAGEVLGLQPGEWVEVKGMPEILRTLDARHCRKGLAFSNDMFGFCGRRFQVQHRIDTLLDEKTGKLRQVQHTVTLVGTDCQKYMGCARQMPLLWRELWLRRVDSPGG